MDTERFTEQRDANREKFLELLKGFRAVMLITQSVSGEIAARPMTIVDLDEQGDLWLPISLGSATLDEITSGCEVFLTAQSSNVYVVASGVASLYSDADTIKRLWSEPMRVWFPEGPEDSDVSFLRLTVHGGEYWDVSGLNKVRYVFHALKSYLAHEKPEIEDQDMHGKVNRDDALILRNPPEVDDRSVI